MRSTLPAVVALMVLALTAVAADDIDQSLVGPNKKVHPVAADGNSFGATSSPGKKYVPLTTINQSPDELRARIDSMLNNGAINMDFTGQPLSEVMDFVHDKFPDLQVYFDDPSMKDAGIDKTTTLVTIKLSDVRLKTALETMLHQFNLGYRVHDGLFIISTKEALDYTLETRIYDCREILSADNDLFRKAFGEKLPSDIAPSSTAKKPTSVAQANNGTSPANENTPVKSRASEYGIDQPNTPAGNLIEVVTNSVRPQSWSDQGGPSSIYEYSGLLIVNQTYDAHTQIADLLDRLSAKLPKEKK